MSLKRWEVINSENLFQGPFFRLRSDNCRLPDGKIMPKYYVIDLLDWVNIVAVTQNQLIMIRQYRHAYGDSFFEIPGGTLDSVDESPLVAAKRELLEETGFVSENWEYRGFHCPNPALQSNRMHTYLAKDCRKEFDQKLDEFENIEVILCEKKEVASMLKSGKIQHSLIAASLTRCIDILV